MAKRTRQHRVVVTGLGVLAPNGVGLGPFWQSILQCKSGIGPITLFDASQLDCNVAGEVPDFNPIKYIDRSFKPHRMARFTQFALAATQMAIKDAGLTVDELRHIPNLPIILGVSTGGLDVVERHLSQVEVKGADHGIPYCTYAYMPHSAAVTIASCLQLKSQPLTLSTACVAGADAIMNAYTAIREGHADIAIAGGSDAPINFTAFTSFSAGGLIPQKKLDPKKASRPFDLLRESGIISEGSGVLILENFEHAVARGIEPYLEIVGYGINMDADPVNSPGAGLADTMLMAMANAGIYFHEIDYICAHGPGHPIMDRVETDMIKKVFGKHAYAVPISSIKGVTGNPLAAAGPYQMVTCALALKNNVIPPTANCENVDPDCDLDYVPGKARITHLNRILINTHGLGGQNCSTVVRRAELI